MHRVYLRDDTGGTWTVAHMQDGTTIVGVVSSDGLSVGFQTDHFSTYAVGNLDTIFCNPTWSADYPLAVPCLFYTESAFAGPGTDVVMMLESARKKMYVQVLKELYLRTQRPRRASELDFVERLAGNLDEVVGNQGKGYEKVLKVFKYLRLMADDALATGKPDLFGYSEEMEALSGGSKLIEDKALEKLSTALLILNCVAEGIGKVFALHEVDYQRALERIEATRPYIVASPLYTKDPAFRSAFAQVEDDIKQLQNSVVAQTLDALSLLADADCGLEVLGEVIKFAMKPLLAVLEASGVGLVATVIFEFAVVDVVMNDMVAATKKGLALSALGTFYSFGGLYEATKDMAGMAVTQASWESESLRNKLLAFEVSNYANIGIHQSAAEVMRMEDAGWLNKTLTDLVSWTAALFGGVDREQIAKAHDARRAELEANDKALVDSFPSLCGGTGAQPAVCGSTVPCIAVCGTKVCGDDGCGGSCGQCGSGKTCDASGQCVPQVCQKDCTGRECGPDPVCGESCGECKQGYACQDGKCVYSASCGNGICDVGETYCNCPDDCQIECGDGCCSSDEDYQNCPQDCQCVPDCSGKQCGDDGCGGSCGQCGGGQMCIVNKCVVSSCPAGYVPISAGTFTMGSPTDEPGRDGDETQHQVTITRAFRLKETEVTQGEWQALMGNNPSYFQSCGSTCPVEKVSWWDAVAYCNALSKKEGLQECYTLSGCSGTPGVVFACTGVTFVGLSCTGYRLPTEAEWEYAARAGTTTSTYNGTIDAEHLYCEQPNPVLDPIAWFCGNSGGTTHPVKQKQPNAWGLHDMLGNVWEWCWDWYDSYPGGAVTDPTGPGTGSDRVFRGGSWYDFARFVRAALRVWDDPGYRGDYLGFRPARSIP
jgi:formylglycine-generating enzyme required for sulfatase activity